jgi:hypothetical protein
MTRIPRFAEFLARNDVSSAGVLPLVHSSQAYHLNDILSDGRLKARPCDVFSGDLLNYFFVGRPAYKHRANGSDSEYWELPICFVFEFEAIDKIKRVFPFDTGAFEKKLYPDYINIMPKEQFDCASVSDAAGKIIGAYFGDVNAYYRLRSKDRGDFESDFGLGVLDAEVKAVHRLSIEKSSTVFDDRRLTIELQAEGDVDLKVRNPIAVIAPANYFDDTQVLRKIEGEWKAQPLSYDVYPLNVGAYFTKIYEMIEVLYRRLGYLR